MSIELRDSISLTSRPRASYGQVVVIDIRVRSADMGRRWTAWRSTIPTGMDTFSGFTVTTRDHQAVQVLSIPVRSPPGPPHGDTLHAAV